ncbi:putative hydroxymethylpyrimidine transport system substrate-binding protein [Desulfopila aestuarii DSM 18488]|uniref:Putative hydroxymethylpyrimidine transport system substrate-binding protein n=2 Tax=Desulfopila aestuarii TaxID=231440 RepID=A0A1M7YB84_9BACT|nr:ABC transporter substrate-binding protein [Desulfopila aestuarii]SHO49788.1 putative hydroxymethylpyrimidine transport system substrate-binding protein [Desulfopila aestuarii DSM 18488]
MNLLRKSIVLTALLLSMHSTGMALAAEKVTVLLDWFVNPDHAPLFVALEKGYFAERGLDVELIAPSNPNDPPKLVAAGKADIAVSYQHQHQMQVEQGLPLVRIATLVATPLNSLVVLEDGPIKSIGDLKGKTIGYSVGGFETALLKVMLAKEGIALSDVKLVNVNFSLSPSLFTGQVDGVIGAFRNFELNQMAIEKRPGHAFFVEEYGIPAYDELILVADRASLGDAKLRRFVDAVEAGVQYLVNHPDESWELFIKGDRKSLDDELNRRAWRDTLPRFALRPGALDRQRYVRFARFLQEQDIVKNVAPLDEWAQELP